MHITIKNFRGLSDLKAEIAPILMLAGSNAAGKTSACTAIAAAASGNLLPFEGITKKSAGLLVRDGAETAMAEIITQDGGARASWPAVERIGDGIIPTASNIAVGLEDLLAMKPIDRAACLIALIRATPTPEDLKAALIKEGITDEDVQKSIAAQVAKGFDNAHAHYKDEGAKLKGQWEKLTGERFGVAKAQTWRPKGWALSLEGAATDTLEAALAAAQEALNEARTNAGADQAQVDALRREAEQLGEHKRALKQAKDELEAQQLVVIRTAADLTKLGEKPKQNQAPLVCPCCQKPLRLFEGALIKADGAEDPEKIAAAMAAYEVAETAARKAAETRDMGLRLVASAEAKVTGAQVAAVKLKDMPKDSGTSKEQIQGAETALSEAEQALKMKLAVIDSVSLLERIQRRIALVDLLDKDGLRQTVLVSKLGEFNGNLVANCKIAGWAPVHIDADMAISYRGRPVSLCSAGEQFRARVILQVTIAQAENAALLVIDGADILDRHGRNGLLGLLSSIEIPAVIGMTILRESEMPDLSKAGIGKSVWIENGAVAEAAVKVAA